MRTILLIFFFVTTLSYSEVLHLQIKYIGINAVDVLMKNQNNHITINAKTNGLIKLVTNLDNHYKIKYQQNYLPEFYLKDINQGNYFENRKTTYTHKDSTAYRISFLDSANVIKYKINSKTRDFFSALFYLRNNLFAKEKTLWIDANSILWKANYTILKKEKLNTILGKKNTLLVKLDFIKMEKDKIETRSDMLTNNLVNEKNSLYFWFTQDEKKIPVKAKFTMKPFSVYWILKEYEE